MTKTLADMTAEIREVVTAKGFRPAKGGTGGKSVGDYLALLDTEIAEALEAFRDYKLADATELYECPPEGCYGVADCAAGHNPLNKPEGVPSELADVLIRFLDMCDAFGWVPFDMDMDLGDVKPLDAPGWCLSFGDHMHWLTRRLCHIDPAGETLSFPAGGATALPYFLRALVAVAEGFDIDLDAEYTRKIAYNRTRSWRHGNRIL